MSRISEDHLYLALQVLSVFQDDHEEKEHVRMIRESYKALIIYIVEQLEEAGVETFTEDDIDNKISEMITQIAINNMIEDGLIEPSIDENGEELYMVTKKGKMALENED
jgi:hypothetical protein